MTNWTSSRFGYFIVRVLAGFALTSTWLEQATSGKVPQSKDGAARLVARIDLTGTTTTFALSPDGTRLAYGESMFADNKIWTELILVDLALGKELARRKYPGGLYSIVFSPERKLLAINSGSKHANVWDVEKWEPKFQLKVPEKYQFGNPLAFSRDGKFVAGHAEDSGGSSYRLIQWDLSTGEGRILGNPGQLHLVPFTAGLRFDPVRFPPTALAFSDTDSALLFAQYYAGDSIRMTSAWVTTAWDIPQGKPLTTIAFGGTGWESSMQGRGLLGKGEPPPGSSLDRMRFRLSPGGRLLGFPKYNQLPFLFVPHDKELWDGDKDGSIAIAVSPLPRPMGTRPQPVLELCRLNEFKHSERRSCRMTRDGKRLVGVGFAPKKSPEERESGLICIWDVSGLHGAARKKTPKLSQEERQRLWDQLLLDLPVPDKPDGYHTVELYDAFHRYQMWGMQEPMLSLVAHPVEAVAWLQKRMGPPLDRDRLPHLLEAVETQKFAEREEATAVLRHWGPLIRSDLEAALAKNPLPTSQSACNKSSNPPRKRLPPATSAPRRSSMYSNTSTPPRLANCSACSPTGGTETSTRPRPR